MDDKEFTDWFRGQFGSLPNPKKHRELSERCITLRGQLATAEIGYKKEDILEAQFQAAMLYENG